MGSVLIKEISKLKDFRGIRALSEPLTLKKFNILVGRNNSGKSTLLDALYLFPDPDRGSPIRKKVSGDTVKSFLSQRKSGSRSLVYKYDGVAELIFQADLDGSWKTWEAHISPNKPSEIRIEGKKSEKISDYTQTLFFPYDTQFMKKLDDFLQDQEEKLIKAQIHKEVAKFISGELDENFTEVFLKKDGWYLRRDDATYIHIMDIGDGVKKIVRTYMVIRLLKPRLILWDDFDAAMHPSFVKGLLKWLYSGNWQVVLSTHSLDVLYYLLDILEDRKNEDEEENIQVLLLRRVNDILYHKALSLEELEDLVDSNTDPRFLATTIKV